jgi:hypothetical protein
MPRQPRRHCAWRTRARAANTSQPVRGVGAIGEPRHPLLPWPGCHTGHRLRAHGAAAEVRSVLPTGNGWYGPSLALPVAAASRAAGRQYDGKAKIPSALGGRSFWRESHSSVDQGACLLVHPVGAAFCTLTLSWSPRRFTTAGPVLQFGWVTPPARRQHFSANDHHPRCGCLGPVQRWDSAVYGPLSGAPALDKNGLFASENFAVGWALLCARYGCVADVTRTDDGVVRCRRWKGTECIGNA